MYLLEARHNMAEARSQISAGGPREQLTANIDALKVTIEVCNLLARSLREQKDAIANENVNTKRMFAAGVNTYKTVKISGQVGQLMSEYQKGFQALRQLHLPRLRPFQNTQLKAELHRLSERMLDHKQ